MRHQCEHAFPCELPYDSGAAPTPAAVRATLCECMLFSDTLCSNLFNTHTLFDKFAEPQKVHFDFLTVTEAELHEVVIPVHFKASHPIVVHGLSFWFDVLFDGDVEKVFLSTSPASPVTHWFVPLPPALSQTHNSRSLTPAASHRPRITHTYAHARGFRVHNHFYHRLHHGRIVQ